jgi:heme exporter protein D
VMYGIQLHRFFMFSYVMTLVSAVLVVASIIVRKQLLSDDSSHS